MPNMTVLPINKTFPAVFRFHAMAKCVARVVEPTPPLAPKKPTTGALAFSSRLCCDALS